MATAAFILTLFANSRCHLLKVSNEAFNFGEYGVQAIGLWCYTAENGILYDISDYTGDSKFEAARGTLVTCTERGE
jgi:hypothetical protein